jgi:hypothetical protein
MSADQPAAQRFVADLYGDLLREFADQIGEGEAAYGKPSQNVREEIVRCVWFGGHFSGRDLALDDGRRLEVLSPGWWNVEGGPDFARAELLLEGEGRLVGDVEVHTVTSGWYAHGHHQQPEYNDVALHVVMWNDRDEPAVTSQDGRQIPQLTLNRAVEEDLEELVEVIDPEAEVGAERRVSPRGRWCTRAVRSGEVEPDWLGRLLDAAGDHRLLERAGAMGEMLQNHPAEQLLYERLAEALGYKSNRMPFLQLAGLLPLSALRGAMPIDLDREDKSRRVEAALFSVAGFLDGEPDESLDQETSAYLAGLREARERLSEALPEVRLSREHWSFSGTRPVNYPPRRIAALARLCGEHLHAGLFSHFLQLVHTARPQGRQRQDVAVRNALVDAFRGLEHAYWSRRYSLGGKKLASPKALVGRQRATSILVDVLLPTLLAHGRRETDKELLRRLRGLWEGLPRRQENAVTRRMKQVLLGTTERAQDIVDSARRQQGLHQLYRDCCHAEAGCEQCVIYLASRAGKTLAVS